MKLLLVAVGLLGGVAHGTKLNRACTFTPDCTKSDENESPGSNQCARLADAACRCNLGNCQIVGYNVFRDTPPTCQSYQDCACKDEPKKCFCQDGDCINEEWECHENADCKQLDKCKDKECACQGNTCEFECSSVSDCENDNYICHTEPGYKCKCEQSICGLERLPKECNDIRECVTLGKCTDDKPCACTNDVCTQPWYVDNEWRSGNKADLNCRWDDDCNYSIAMCVGGAEGRDNLCTCQDQVEVTEYESWGKCKLA